MKFAVLLIILCLGLTLSGCALFKSNPATKHNCTIEGIVIDTSTNTPILGASVRIQNTKLDSMTDDSGYFIISKLTPGKYNLEISAVGYPTTNEGVIVSFPKNDPIYFFLVANKSELNNAIVRVYRKDEIRGYVIENKTNSPILYASIRIEGTKLGALTDSLGRFCIHNVPPGEYTLDVSAVGFKSEHIVHVTVPSHYGYLVPVRLNYKSLEDDSGGI
jgi:hypothetical protein